MYKFLIILLWCIGVVCVETSANGNLSGKVVTVIDGNTIEVLGEDKETYKIVLAGVDSPELTQEYGEKAKKYLEKILLQKEVAVQFQGKDRKGNYVAVVLKGDVDPRIELLKEGLAWTAERDPLPELEIHRVSAEEKNKGLWRDENPTPPWIHRRALSMMQPKSS
jgi:endonuclease YncB( thermonuclease family)